MRGGIPERKLKPLWDAIDHRQYKSAMKLVTGLLAKHTDSAYLFVSCRWPMIQARDWQFLIPDFLHEHPCIGKFTSWLQILTWISYSWRLVGIEGIDTGEVGEITWSIGACSSRQGCEPLGWFDFEYTPDCVPTLEYVCVLALISTFWISCTELTCSSYLVILEVRSV